MVLERELALSILYTPAGFIIAAPYYAVHVRVLYILAFRCTGHSTVLIFMLRTRNRIFQAEREWIYLVFYWQALGPVTIKKQEA